MDNEKLRIINEMAKDISKLENLICEFEESIRYIFDRHVCDIIIDNPGLVLESVLSITRRHYKTDLETLKKEFSLM